MGKQRSRLVLVVAIAVGLLLADHVFADVTTNRSGSILVFPKVIADGTRDTIIQISNTSNSLVRAHCFYVNAALTDPTQPEGVFNWRLWQEVDFDIVLTRQQPTHWAASRGRRVNPFDTACSRDLVCVGEMNRGAPCTKANAATVCGESYLCSFNGYCDDAGFDPGLIPPVVPAFEGELKCVEVDDSGAPLAGNRLKGEATLVALPVPGEMNLQTLPRLDTPGGTVSLIPGEASKYNAIGIEGLENNGDGTLVLGGGQCVGSGALQGSVCETDESCGESSPCALEYNACPQSWIVNHFAGGAPDPIIENVRIGAAQEEYPGDPSRVHTQLTVVPCTQNFETQEPTSVTLQFLTHDEFELQFSVSTTVTCWGNFFLEDLGATALTFAGTLVPDPQGTMFLKTRIRSAGATPFGVLMMAEEFHVAKKSMIEDFEGVLASPAAVNVHIEGERSNPDLIIIPAEQIAP